MNYFQSVKTSVQVSTVPKLTLALYLHVQQGLYISSQFKNWFMLSVHMSSYGWKQEAGSLESQKEV